jgi:hypothetical protein
MSQQSSQCVTNDRTHDKLMKVTNLIGGLFFFLFLDLILIRLTISIWGCFKDVSSSECAYKFEC